MTVFRFVVPMRKHMTACAVRITCLELREKGFEKITDNNIGRTTVKVIIDSKKPEFTEKRFQLNSQKINLSLKKLHFTEKHRKRITFETLCDKCRNYVTTFCRTPRTVPTRTCFLSLRIDKRRTEIEYRYNRTIVQFNYTYNQQFNYVEIPVSAIEHN
ncbi:hypothetical protein BD560DRAFT_428462 [Blakeslea trispora]|nr:hypothetical protein BD560DRAFT_428462 [Blakeslea trispora]